MLTGKNERGRPDACCAASIVLQVKPVFFDLCIFFFLVFNHSCILKVHKQLALYYQCHCG